ncbi:hypothetical protein Droror1_Dr00011020 [Drosera rotundifolia]
MSVLEHERNAGERAGGGASGEIVGSVVTLEKKLVPIQVAAKEVESRGSLLDRVSALEDRSLKLCLELDSKGMPTSQSSGMQASSCARDHSSNEQQHSRQDPKPSQHQDYELASEALQAASCREPEKPKHETTLKQDNKKNKAKTTIMGQRKRSPHAWLHARERLVLC